MEKLVLVPQDKYKRLNTTNTTPKNNVQNTEVQPAKEVKVKNDDNKVITQPPPGIPSFETESSVKRSNAHDERVDHNLSSGEDITDTEDEEESAPKTWSEAWVAV